MCIRERAETKPVEPNGTSASASDGDAGVFGEHEEISVGRRPRVAAAARLYGEHKALAGAIEAGALPPSIR